MNIPRTNAVDLREITEGRSKSPIPQREYRYKGTKGDACAHRVKVTASFLSPLPHKTGQFSQYRPLSPAPTGHRLGCNPETPKGSFFGCELREGPFKASQVNSKLRKNSENYLGMNRPSGDGDFYSNRHQRQKGKGLNVPGPSKRILQKQRKGSCQLQHVTFFKARKQSTNEDALATSKISHMETAKAKRKGWEQTNNFQLSTNYNLEQGNADLTQSQIDCPRQHTRKHSQLQHVTFFNARKQSINEDALATSRISHMVTPKAKRRGWEQTNNFQLSNNQNLEEHNAGLSQSQIDRPRQHTRKHSDNFYMKKVPAFLVTPKNYRQSFDNCQMQKQRVLGIQDFMIVKELGRGAFGRVVLAIERRGKLVCAIKIMSKREIIQSGMQDQLVRELKIQMFINHPNVAKVYGFFDDLLHFYTMMECALDGHLSEHLARRTVPIKEEEAAVLLYQTCSAVAALHTHSVIHRDLKPENLLMHEGIIKLSDFGWSVNRGAQLRSTFCGTPIYLCPQILMGDEYDQSVDIWTIGVILYEMLYRTNPFRITRQQELANILSSEIVFDDSQVSDSAKEVIRACLNKKAADRPNIRELMFFQFLLREHAAEEFKR